MSLQTTDRECRFCFSPAAVVTPAFSSRGHLKYQSTACHMHREHPNPEECTREGQDYCSHLYKGVLVCSLYAKQAQSPYPVQFSPLL